MENLSLRKYCPDDSETFQRFGSDAVLRKEIEEAGDKVTEIIEA